jgi:hypothetical protein
MKWFMKPCQGVRGLRCCLLITWCGCCRPGAQLLIQWASNGRTKWVKRLNCILLAEDRAAFRFRLLQAQRMRDEVRWPSRAHHDAC